MSLFNRKSLSALLPAVVAAASLALIAPAVHAQGPGGGPGGGRPPMTPEMQKQMQAFRKFSENHKNYRSLGQTLMAMGEMDKTPTTKITGAQAKKILPIFKAWRSKPVMTDAQALAVNKQITSAMSIPQIKKVATTQVGGRRGGGGGGGQRPSGGGGGFGGGGGGQRPGGGGAGGTFKMTPPKEYNPLNPDSMPERMRARGKTRIDGLTTMLKAKAS